MQKHAIPALSLFMVILLVSFCKKVSEHNENLIGKWQGTEWTIAGKPDQDASIVHFTFVEDGTYTAQLGEGYSEMGVWRTEKDKLYTTAQGKKEIMVKLLTYDGKNLDFEMNRGGTHEVLKLKKE